MSDMPVAIVTGAGKGIGEGTARLLVERGYRVCFTDVDPNALIAATAGLDESRVLRVVADVAVEADMRRMAAATLERFGRIDGLHSNAGIIGQGGLLRDADTMDFAHVMNVNLRGAFHAAQAVLPTMMVQKSGSIAFTSSTGGLKAAPLVGVYSISKFALIGLMKNLAADVADCGIRVNAVAPGLTDTPAFRETRERSGRGGEGKFFDNRVVPLGRIGTAQDVGEAIFYLFSDASLYVTGTVITVDGGLTL